MIDDLHAHAWPLVGLFLGWAAHIWTAAREMSTAKGVRIWPWGFVLRRPMRCGMSVFGAIGGYFVLVDLEMVSIGAAFGVGLLSDLVLDSLRGMTAQRLGMDTTQERPAVDLNDTTVMRPEDKQR